MKKLFIILLAFCLTTFMCVSCASIPEEQKADTYEVEAYEFYIDPTKGKDWAEQYVYIIYEKDVKLAKKTAEPVFVSKLMDRTLLKGIYFLDYKCGFKEAYNKCIKLDESYRLGTNSSGAKKYFINVSANYTKDTELLKLIKRMFKIGKNDRFYAVRIVVDSKEVLSSKTYTYDYVNSIGNSENGKIFTYLYTNDEVCFNDFRNLQAAGRPCYTSVLRQEILRWKKK